jgi:hypothetical protein
MAPYILALEGWSTSYYYVMLLLAGQLQHQQVCHKQRGCLGETSESLFQHSSLTITGRAANNTI